MCIIKNKQTKNTSTCSNSCEIKSFFLRRARWHFLKCQWYSLNAKTWKYAQHVISTVKFTTWKNSCARCPCIKKHEREQLYFPAIRYLFCPWHNLWESSSASSEKDRERQKEKKIVKRMGKNGCACCNGG